MNAAYAQPAGAVNDHFIYDVQSGDTLSDIANTYTTTQNNWRLLQQLNNVSDTLALPIGKSVAIPFSIIPLITSRATITHTKGNVLVNGNLAQENGVVVENDTIITGDNGFITLLLNDNSSISIAPNSTVFVQRMNHFERTGLGDSVFLLEQGSTENRVAPDNRGVGRFEVQTPIAITGVRGTSLRVRHQQQQSSTEVLTGKAQLFAEQKTPYTVAQQHGAVIHADGTIQAAMLLDAPIIVNTINNAQQRQLVFEPVANAERYTVQTSLDEAGNNVVARITTTDTTLPLRSYGTGTHYVHVRAIDALGLEGFDASMRYEGQSTLSSRDGTPIMSRFGFPVTLQDY